MENTFSQKRVYIIFTLFIPHGFFTKNPFLSFQSKTKTPTVLTPCSVGGQKKNSKISCFYFYILAHCEFILRI